jgi:hypothetical protein
VDISIYVLPIFLLFVLIKKTGNPSYSGAVADEFTVHSSQKLLRRAKIMNS